MVAPKGPVDADIVIRFGAGLHTRATEDEIDDREAAGGHNFLLDLERGELKPRPAFDLVGTAPNAGQIQGGFSLLKSDGTVQTAFQAGNTVYEWDGDSFQASPTLGTVNASAKLRGHWRSHNFTLDDLVLVTDLALLEAVKSWDGTTLTNITFQSAASISFGTFLAKYCAVANERAIFAHVKDASSTLPHLIVGSMRGDFTRISVSDRPSSALNEEDPFFIPMPDLKPINGFIEAFRAVIASTEKGKIFNLAGESAQDFTIEDFFPGSAASGEESIAYAGNDVVYGRQGRIESIKNIDQFGDTESDDLTRPIADVIEEYTGWRIVYNSRLNRIYAFPAGQSEVWVLNTSMRNSGEGKSPWMRWMTSHDLAFVPTYVGSHLDPSDGLEYTIMGDSSGNIYKLEGEGHLGDGGTHPIALEYLTKLYSLPLNAQAYDVEGYIRYRKDEPVTVTLTFEFAGENIFNQAVTVDVPGVSNVPYWGGFHWDDGTHWGTIRGKLSRQKFTPPGQGNEFQVRIKAESINSYAITEIGLRFRAAS